MAYWDPAWKNVVIYGAGLSSEPFGDYNSIIDEVLKAGFDGIYLDWVEGFENVEVAAAARAEGKDPAVEMIRFIQEMAAFGDARDPDFLIIQQNAAALSVGRPELYATIDGIAQEAIWFDGDATDDWADPNGRDFVNEADLVTYYLDLLVAYQNVGVPVFDCEYALERAPDAYRRAAERGFVGYVTRRSLSRLTTTLPPGY